MGNKILIINPGTGGKAEVEDDDTLKTTMDNASHITGDLSRITGTLQSGKER